MTFQRDLSDSASDFRRVVWPIISPMCGGGEIVPVESVTDSGFANILDQMAGIDAWHVIKDRSLVRGIASRVQWGVKNWDTFTVRTWRLSGVKTEYDKRKDAQARGFLFPALTVQAYVDKRGGEGRLLSVGMIQTPTLIGLVDQGVGYPKDNHDGRSGFWVVPWATAKKSGAKLYTWPAMNVLPLASATPSAV